MKLKLLAALLFCSLLSKAQDANDAIDKRIDAKLTPAVTNATAQIATQVKTAIAALGPFETDTVVTATKAASAAFNIDTLFVKAGTQVTFYVDLSCDNNANKETGGAGKKVRVQNVNGVCKLIPMGDYPVYSGAGTVAKAGWSIVLVGNFVVIQCIPVAGLTINWQVEVKANYPQKL